MRSKEERRALHRTPQRRTRGKATSKNTAGTNIKRDGKSIYQETIVDGQKLYHEVKTTPQQSVGAGTTNIESLTIIGTEGSVQSSGAVGSHGDLTDVSSDQHHPQLHNLASHTDRVLDELTLSSADDTRLEIIDTGTSGGSSSVVVRSDGSNNSIYTTTAHDLNIYTHSNNNQLFLRQSNGYVGIGTNLPATLFHTKTSSTTTNRLSIESDAEFFQVFVEDADLTGIMFKDGADLQIGQASNLTGSGWDARVAIKDGGNVGIGTTTAPDLLSLKVDNSKFISLDREANGSVDNTAYIGVSAVTSGLPFMWMGFDDSNVDDFVIRDDGNIGIGTTAPAHLLDLKSSNDCELSLTAGSSDHATIFMTSDNANADDDKWRLQANNGVYWAIANKTTGSWTEYLTISYQGRVGIGTNSTAYSLHIKGGGTGATSLGATLALQGTDAEVVSGDDLGTILFLGSDYEEGVSTPPQIGAMILAEAKGTTNWDDANANDAPADLKFYVNDNHADNAIGDQALMTLNGESGLVGIGIETPSAKLTVLGDDSSDTWRGNIEVQDSTAMAAGVGPAISFVGKYKTEGNYAHFARIKSFKADATTSEVSAGLKMQVRKEGVANYIDALTIKYNGDVGIGTNDPADSLNIHGISGSNLGIKITRGSQDHGLRLGVNDTHAFLWTDQAQNIALATTNTERLTIYAGGHVGAHSTIGSPTSASGFTGSGWHIDSGGVASFNDAYIRGTLSVYELLIQQVRATNGSLFITSCARVEHILGAGDPPAQLFGSDGSAYGGATRVITFENSDTDYDYTPFLANDIILSQRVTIAGRVQKSATSGGANNDDHVIRKCIYKVVSVSGLAVTVTEAPGYTNTMAPQSGDDFVRIGNTANDERQGAIYLTSDDHESPYLEVKGGVVHAGAAVDGSGASTPGGWNGGDTTKLRLGRLDGITNTDAGLDGNQADLYGLYADGVYLKGHIHATDGEIGGWKIDPGILKSANDQIVLKASDNTMYVDIGGTGTQTKYIHVGQTSNNGTSYTGNYGISAIDGNDNWLFRLDDAAKEIAGWQFDTAKFYKNSGATYIGLDSANTKIQLGEKAAIGDDKDGMCLSLDGIALGADNVFTVTKAGYVTAKSGTIGGWTLSSDTIHTGADATSFILDKNNKKLRIGAKADIDDGNIGVHLGTDGLAIGANSVFKVTAAGVLTATSGTIAGWSIESGYLEKDGTRLNAGTNNGYLGIGVTEYNANDGIWLGEVSDGVYKFSINNSDGSKYFRYTDSAFEIAAGNFSLDSSGNITATNANLSGTITASHINLSTAAISGTLSASKITAGTITADRMDTSFMTSSELNLTNSADADCGLRITNDGDGYNQIVMEGANCELLMGWTGSGASPTSDADGSNKIKMNRATGDHMTSIQFYKAGASNFSLGEHGDSFRIVYGDDVRDDGQDIGHLTDKRALDINSSGHCSMPLGFKPNYQSSWTYVQSPGAGGDGVDIRPVFTHNLGSQMLIVQIFLSTASDGSGHIFSISGGGSFAASTAHESDMHVYMKDDNKVEVAVGNDYVYIYDNTSLSTSVTKMTEGYIKVLLWKTGVSDG